MEVLLGVRVVLVLVLAAVYVSYPETLFSTRVQFVLFCCVKLGS